MKLRLIMKNGWKLSGKQISEDKTHLTIDDIIVGETEVLKSEIAIKTKVIE